MFNILPYVLEYEKFQSYSQKLGFRVTVHLGF